MLSVKDKLKRIFLIGFLLIGLTSQSQVLITLLLGDKLNSEGLEFGLEGGLNWTQITGMETKTFARKWNLGFYFDIRLKNQWYLYTGVLIKANMGVDKLTENDLDFLQATIYTYDSAGTNALPGEYSQKMNYFLVPALIRYKFKKRLYVEAGPQFGLMYKSWVEFGSDIDGNDATIKEYNTESLNKIDVGIMTGIGYTLRRSPGMSFGVKYYEGFVNVYKNSAGHRNRSIFIYATIPIGAGEKADNKEKPKKENSTNDSR